MGEQVLAEGDGERAASIFRQIAEIAPEDAGAQSGLVRALIAAGRSDEAREAFDALPEELRKDPVIAQAAAYAGYSLVLLGESSCSAALDGGPELTPEQVLTEAESRFTKAIDAAQAANNTDILNMARVGRARARVDLKKFADAKADAELVPPTYVHNATYSQANAWFLTYLPYYGDISRLDSDGDGIPCESLPGAP